MYWISGILFVSAFFVENGFTKLAPDFIHPCTVDNVTCLIQSTKDAIPGFVKGLPELGVPSLDPFHIENLTIVLPGLKTTFTGRVTGFRKAIIDNIESNFKKGKFVLEFRTDVTLKGQYGATGRILTFPINGEGDAKIKATNLKVKITLSLQMVSDDKGVQHFGLKNYKSTFEWGDKAIYNLTNLFKGSPELSNTVLQFLNENWRIVAEEFGKPLVDYTTEKAVRTIEKFFLAVPYDELVDGPLP